MSERRFHFLRASNFLHLARVLRVRDSLSSGRRISMVVESSSVPRKVNFGDGPWVFDGS